MIKLFKKLLLCITIIACVLCCTLTTYADDSQVFEGTATSTLTYREQSTYCVLIPSYIDMSDTYVFSAENINITDNEMIVVSVSNTINDCGIQFTHESGNHSLTKNIEQVPMSDSIPTELSPNCVGIFVGDNRTSAIGFRLSMESFGTEKAYAGMYSAIVEFSVSLATK